MQEKYPFLSLWKKDGMKNFPSIPFQPIVDHFVTEFFEPIPELKAMNSKPLLDDDFEIRHRQILNEIKGEVMGKNAPAWDGIRNLKNVDYKWWRCALEPAVNKFIFEETEKAIIFDYFRWGKIVAAARKELLNGADREKVLRELGNKVLPSKRGGASLLSGIQLRTLKNVYLEMQEAIKEARRTLDLNVNHPDPDEARHYEWLDLDGVCLWANTVFRQSEFKKIVSKQSPADAAAETIVKRLREVLKTNITSGRSLQDRLQNIPPIVRRD